MIFTFQISFGASYHEWSPAFLVEAIDISSLTEEDLGNLDIVLEDGKMDRGPFVIRVGAIDEAIFDGFCIEFLDLEDLLKFCDGDNLVEDLEDFVDC